MLCVLWRSALACFRATQCPVCNLWAAELDITYPSTWTLSLAEAWLVSWQLLFGHDPLSQVST